MSTLRFYLWKEWREHRTVLVALSLVLPFATWLLSLPLSRGWVNDRLFHAAVALGFAVVLLIAVGGELLGAERRGNGLRWLERLPAGLAAPFWAKLVFFVTTTVVATTVGYGSGWLVGFLRPHGAAGGPMRFAPSLLLLVIVAVVWGLWTFSASAWALRGGLALLVSAMILGVVGYPLWRVVDAGYHPRPGELALLIALLALTAFVGAWLAFVRAARFGQGTLAATLHGLTPVLPVLLLGLGWSSTRLAEREVYDPGREDFVFSGRELTSDGRFAFGVGRHELSHWDADSMPEHSLRIDLERGLVERLGSHVTCGMRYREDEQGRPCPDSILVSVEGERLPLVFDATDGAPRSWNARDHDFYWFSQGLGFYIQRGVGQPDCVRDPFRGRDYSTSELPRPRGKLLVRPGRWLLSSGERTLAEPARRSSNPWSWYDPDSKERSPVDWEPGVEPLVVLEDGRILISDATHVRVIDPERGPSVLLDTHGIPGKDIRPNSNGLRRPNSPRDMEVDPSGPILLRAKDYQLLVIDPELTQVRSLEVPGGLQVRGRVGSHEFIVFDHWKDGSVSRLDVTTGELTRLWPRPKD